jgi:hypothetical protein
MAVWLIPAGSHGEYELKFIQEGRVYVTWSDLDIDLEKLSQRSELTAAMTQRYPDTKPKAIANWVGQVWPFAHEIKKSDLVVLPLKSRRASRSERSPATTISNLPGRAHSSTGARLSGSAKPCRVRTSGKTC